MTSQDFLAEARTHHSDAWAAPTPGLARQAARWAMEAAAAAARAAESADTEDDWSAAARAATLASDAMQAPKHKAAARAPA